MRLEPLAGDWPSNTVDFLCESGCSVPILVCIHSAKFAWSLGSCYSVIEHRILPLFHKFFNRSRLEAVDSIQTQAHLPNLRSSCNPQKESSSSLKLHPCDHQRAGQSRSFPSPSQE